MLTYFSKNCGNQTNIKARLFDILMCVSWTLMCVSDDDWDKLLLRMRAVHTLTLSEIMFSFFFFNHLSMIKDRNGPPCAAPSVAPCVAPCELLSVHFTEKISSANNEFRRIFFSFLAMFTTHNVLLRTHKTLLIFWMKVARTRLWAISYSEK